jgi:hypothetical protein
MTTCYRCGTSVGTSPEALRKAELFAKKSKETLVESLVVYKRTTNPYSAYRGPRKTQVTTNDRIKEHYINATRKQKKDHEGVKRQYASITERWKHDKLYQQALLELDPNFSDETAAEWDAIALRELEKPKDAGAIPWWEREKYWRAERVVSTQQGGRDQVPRVNLSMGSASAESSAGGPAATSTSSSTGGPVATPAPVAMIARDIRYPDAQPTVPPPAQAAVPHPRAAPRMQQWKKQWTDREWRDWNAWHYRGWRSR